MSRSGGRVTRRRSFAGSLSPSRQFSAILLCALTSFAAAADPPITAIAFAPDGRSLVVASQRGMRIARLPELRIAYEAADGPSMVMDLEFREDQLLVAGGEPGESAVLAMRNSIRAADGQLEGFGPPAFIPTPFRDCIYSARWSPSGGAVAAAAFDGTGAVFELSMSKTKSVFAGHSGALTGVVWLDDNLLASSSRDTTIRLWKPEDGDLVRTLNNHTGQVLGLALAPGAEGLPVVASIGDDATIRFWQPTIGRMLRFVRLVNERPVCQAWSANGQFLYAGTTGGKILRIEAATARTVESIQVTSGWVTALSVSANDWIAFGTSDGDLDAFAGPRLLERRSTGADSRAGS